MPSQGDEIKAKLNSLSPQQRRMLLQSIPARPRPQASIPRYPLTDVVPQSYSQRRLWYLYKLDPDSSMYNMPQAALFRGPLDYSCLQQAFDDVVARHGVLRTVFADENGVPVQKVASHRAHRIELVDLSHEKSTQCEAQGLALAQEIADRPFDLVHGPVVMMTIIKLQDHVHLMVINMHHIISDGWSVTIFVQDFLELYRSRIQCRPAQLPRLTIAFSDFVQWQLERLRGDVLQRQLDFWQARLAGIQPLALPFDRAPTVHTSARSGYEKIELSPQARNQLLAVAEDCECTLFMAILAVFKVVLYRYSGQADINVGVPVAGRNRIETENLIGFFANTALIRTDLGGEPAFRELLLRVRESALEAFAHDETPFEKLVELIQPDRDIARNPLFQVMFILQNTAKPVIDIPGVQAQMLDSYNSTVKFDMLAEFYDTDKGLRGGIGYRSDLFEAGTMAQFARAFGEVVAAVSAGPHAKITDIVLATARPSVVESFSDFLE
jgi:hypothetical protein